jgi:tetratricopeptide (TPR) repeat protein
MHSLSWLQYSYLQQHRYADAKRLIGEAMADHREDMQVRYAAETGEWNAFTFTKPLGRALQAIADKRLDDAQRLIREVKPGGPEPDEARAMLAEAKGNLPEALRDAQLAIAAEEKLGVPSGPPENFKPAHELYGELLMKAGETDEALAQFQASLLRTPNRAASVADSERAKAARAPRSSM